MCGQTCGPPKQIWLNSPTENVNLSRLRCELARLPVLKRINIHTSKTIPSVRVWCQTQSGIFTAPRLPLIDRWDYSADIEMHVLSLHADEILQLRFISNIRWWFGFNWRIQLQCKNPYPANCSFLVDLGINIWGTRPALQRCNAVNLVWGYTWNYQLSEAVIWLSDANRAGVGWGLNSDGDLHRADYFSIIHLQQNIIALSWASGDDRSNQIIRHADHSHCRLIMKEPSHFARVQPAGMLLYCSSLPDQSDIFGVRRPDLRQRSLMAAPTARACSSCLSAASKEMSDSWVHFDQSNQYSANGFSYFSPLLPRTNEPHLVKICSNHSWTKYLVWQYLQAVAGPESANNVSSVLFFLFGEV